MIIIHEGEDHGCGAVLSDIFELRCGCQVPIVADACKVEHKNNMPECEGWINSEKVKVLRDTGCSTVVVRRY